MKIKIRPNTFETNSSSTHSMVIGAKDEVKKWIQGIIVYDMNSDKFITPEKAKEIVFTDSDAEMKHYCTLSKEEKELYLEEYYPWHTVESFEQELYIASDLYTYEAYCNHNERLETDTTYYTTPGGEELAIVCSYGYDS